MTFWQDPQFWIAMWGGITGSLALVFTWLSYSKDQPRLDVAANLHMVSTQQKPEPHWVFDVILRNRGRRPCYIDHVGIEVRVDSIKLGDVEMKPTGPALFHIYRSQDSGMVRLDENERKTIVSDPFSEGLAHMVWSSNNRYGYLLVVDSLGREIRHRFDLPPKIEQMAKRKEGSSRVGGDD